MGNVIPQESAPQGANPDTSQDPTVTPAGNAGTTAGTTAGPQGGTPPGGGTDPTPTPPSTPTPGSGFVYVMSNQETGNSVTVFNRSVYGDLTRGGTFVTGGLGVGKSYDLEAASDPMVSQGSLIASPDQRFLLAVDAGSNEVSSLAIEGDQLRLVTRVPSGGVRPVSLTVHGDLVYVVNAGGLPPNTPPNPDAVIAGFTLGEDGTLTPLEGSVKPLLGGPAAGPSQIAFTPDGTQLIVTERQTNIIDVFLIDGCGLPGDPVRNESNGPAPFTASFQGEDVLLVTEIIGVNFTYGSLSTYRLSPDGKLTVISGSVNTTERTACWTADSVLDPSITYIANNQSGTVSGCRFAEDGSITMFPEDGHLVTARDQHATQDMAITNDGRFLYVLTAGYDEKIVDPRLPTYVEGSPYSNRMSISAYRIEANGSLTALTGYAVADEPPTVASVGLLELQTGIAPGSEGLVAI
ncbi:lactonase family protein [Streptomyces sp. N2-109]|uniref:Lactonase family protein n=1 Tax=Streptomyces gossypii TaxID=2883101 RepID=A0ABT2JYH1_9ACTN|nr:lactonase family protein [Streptomyces gossypii]MCT2592728.1 lactonase family protein [Streptomyces gossypii]